MGGGTSKNRIATAISDNRTPQDDAMSFRGKIGGLKLILGSDEKKSALLKYLEMRNKGCLLSWYFDLDEYKRTNKDNLLHKALDLRNRYDPNFHIGQRDSTLDYVWSSVNETLPRHSTASSKSLSVSINVHENEKKIKIAQDHISSLLANELDDFLNSDQYSILETSEHNTGRVHEHNSQVSTGGVNNEGTCILAAAVLEKELKETYKNILIIHDSYLKSKMLSRSLESHGHRVRLANHGRVGVNIATNGNFGVILIDTCLQTMDSVEVSKEIKKWHSMIDNKATFSSVRLVDSNSKTSIITNTNTSVNNNSSNSVSSKKKRRSSLFAYVKSPFSTTVLDEQKKQDIKATPSSKQITPLLIGMLTKESGDMKDIENIERTGRAQSFKQNFDDLITCNASAPITSFVSADSVNTSLATNFKTSHTATAAPISSKGTAAANSNKSRSNKSNNPQLTFPINDFNVKITQLHELMSLTPSTLSFVKQSSGTSSNVGAFSASTSTSINID